MNKYTQDMTGTGQYIELPDPGPEPERYYDWMLWKLRQSPEWHNALKSKPKRNWIGKLMKFDSLNTFYVNIETNENNIPVHFKRIGTKWRVKEIEALQKYLRECDEDMTTLLDQLDIINKELLVLNKEYEAILGRIKELHEIDNNN